jgi:hypothetical protein
MLLLLKKKWCLRDLSAFGCQRQSQQQKQLQLVGRAWQSCAECHSSQLVTAATAA